MHTRPGHLRHRLRYCSWPHSHVNEVSSCLSSANKWWRLMPCLSDSGYIVGIWNELYWPQYRTLGDNARDRKDSILLCRTPGYARLDRNETISVRVIRWGTVVVGHRAEYHGPPCQMLRLDQEEPGMLPCPHRRRGWHHSER